MKPHKNPAAVALGRLGGKAKSAAKTKAAREQVNHRDGNKTNNVASNLEWTDRSGNQLHAVDMGLKPSGEKSHLCTKLTRDSAVQLLSLKGTTSQAKAGVIFGVSQTYVGKIWRGTKWRQLQRQ